jgi:hypothetical protein
LAALTWDKGMVQCRHFSALSWISPSQNGHFFIAAP